MTTSKSYVYVLYRDNKPIYVGSTTNIDQRIGAHSGRISFDTYRATEFETEDEARECEKAIIRTLRPEENKLFYDYKWHDGSRPERAIEATTQPLTIRLPSELHDELTNISEQTGIAVSKLTRIAVAQFVERTAKDGLVVQINPRASA